MENFINNIYKRKGYFPYWVEEAIKLAGIKLKLNLPLSNLESDESFDANQF